MVLELDYQMQDFALTTARKSIWFVPNSVSIFLDFCKSSAVCCTSKLA